MTHRVSRITLPSGLVVRAAAGSYVWLHELCPMAREHSPMPRDFNPGSGLSKTHVQAKHDVCGLWALWLPRETT